MSIAAFHITALFFFVATLVYIWYLISHSETVLRVGKGLLIAGFCSNGAAIVLRWIETGRTPAANMFESISLLAWIIVGLYLIIELRYRLPVVGSFVAPFVLLLLITASFLPMQIIPLAPSLRSYWLPIHVTLALLGNAFFILSFIFAIMYLIQERYLKKRRISGLYFLLPSLDILDELNYRSLSYGFPLLTLAMITGAVWAEYVWGSYWSWEPRQTWSLITWFLYAALLHGRLAIGWRGRKAAVFSIACVSVLLGSFFMINLLSWGEHGFLR